MTVVQAIAHFETILVDAIDKDSTTMVLDSVSTPAGNLPAGTYGFVLEQESNSKREYIMGTLSGTTLTFTKRDVSPFDATTVDSSGDDTRKSHRKGASVKLSNFPALLQIARILNGVDQLDGSAPLQYDSNPTISNNADIATKKYVDDNVNGGAVSIDSTLLNATAGETVAAGNVVYLNTSDNEWYVADKDEIYAAGTRFGVAQGAGTDGASITDGVIIYGLDTNQSGLTAGAKYYLGDDGAITTTQGDYIVGIAYSTTTLIFDFEIADKTPTGTVSPYAGATAPFGWLACDGAAIDNNTYEDLFNLLIADNFKYGVGTAATFTVDTATDIITSATHSLSNGDIVYLRSTGTLPTGLSADTKYYVISSTTNTFQLSLTAGGSAIDITATGSGTHSWYGTFKIPQLEGSVPVGYGQRVETFTFVDADVNTGTDVITVDSNQFLHNGQAVALTTSGTLPSGLSATTYYVIRLTATTISLATSIANANAGTAVDITAAAGGGTHTLTLTLTDRDLGDVGGEETTQMSDSQMPSHVHQIDDYNGGSGSAIDLTTNTANTNTPKNTESAGSDVAQNNMPPYTVLNYIIKT